MSSEPGSEQRTLRHEIGIRIVDEIPHGVGRTRAPRTHCEFVGLARKGRKFYADACDISCPLARYYLGLDPPNEETMEKLKHTLVGWGSRRFPWRV